MYKHWVHRQLESAGLTINNDQADPQYNLKVFDERFYVCSALKGSLGFGESYADGNWDCTHLDKIEQAGHFGRHFYRVWEYYLLSCAAMFRARKAQLMQLVLSPDGVAGGYRRVS